MPKSSLAADHVIVSLAARQHGVVTRVQLLSAGLAANVVHHRVRTRWIRPVHRGVYVVEALTGRRTREMAAVLAAGPSAVLSHRSAAALWGFLPKAAPSAPVDVSVLGRDGGRDRRSIRCHRASALPSDEITTLQSIPVTGPARTLLDIAGLARCRELEQAIADTESRGLTTHTKLRVLLDRYPRRRARGRLLAVLDSASGPLLARSEAEEQFLALIKRSQLPLPEMNVRFAGAERDFLWRRQRLVVEVDGFAFHSSRKQFENDRLRDGDLAAEWFRVIRVTWRQIVEEPEPLLVRLALALTKRS